MLLKLIFGNALRHKLRTSLTVVGMTVAVLAFGLLSTVVDAWYAGAEGASANRLVTRNAISLVFFLPITYANRIKAVEGVRAVSYASWFGGVYKEPRNFFPQFAVDAASYLDLHSEFVVDPAQRTAFLRDRKGALVGRKLAETYGWRLGDTVQLKGTIYPGQWEFVVRAIYDGTSKNTDLTQMFFHWDYVNEVITKRLPRRANLVGIFVVEAENSEILARVSRDIDSQFRNSYAETMTETEKAFQLGFVSMTEAIVVAIRMVSYLVILIILAVMANTMAMTARERTAEHATLRALGFGPLFLAALIFGEALVIAAIGGGLGAAATLPIADWFGRQMGSLFKVFNVSGTTLSMQLLAALGVGVISAVFPAVRAGRVKIVDGLRAIG